MTYMSGSSSDPDLDRLNPRPAQPWVGALHPIRVLPRAMTEGTTRPSPFTGRSSGASVGRILSSFRGGSKVRESRERRASPGTTPPPGVCHQRPPAAVDQRAPGPVRDLASSRVPARPPPRGVCPLGGWSRRVKSAGRCWRASRRLPSWLQAGRDSSPRASPGCSRHVARPSCATGTACRRCPGCLRRPR